MKFQIILLLCLIFISCNKDDNTGNLSGTVTDTYGHPLEGATIDCQYSKTVTDNRGRYSFINLPSRNYNVVVTLEHYISLNRKVEIIENRESELDFFLEAGDPFLVVSDSVLEISSNRARLTFDIKTNSSWEISGSCNWVSCSELQGSGNERISLEIESNDSSLKRSATLIITSGNFLKSVQINQNSKLKLLSLKGIIGNDEIGVLDSVLLVFNKPIVNYSIVSDYIYCYPEIFDEIVQNGYGIRFAYGCARLAEEFPFLVKATAIDGEVFDQRITVPFYLNKLALDGTISSFSLLDDQRYCWITTQNPDAFLNIDLHSMTIKCNYGLDFTPQGLSYNYYNNFLYIYGDDRIDVYNQSGNFIKTLSFEFPGTVLRAYTLVFCNNGYGVMLYQAMNRGTSWKVIDSSKEDSMYYHPIIFENNHYLNFKNAWLNHNRNQIILLHDYASCDLSYLDDITHELTTITPASTTQGEFITPNRLDDRIYIGQLYDQFIMNPDFTISNVSYIDNKNNGSADFSYRENGENLIYFCDANTLRIMDYGNSSTIMSCENKYGLKDFIADTRGIYTYVHDYKNIYKFQATDLFSHINK